MSNVVTKDMVLKADIGLLVKIYEWWIPKFGDVILELDDDLCYIIDAITDEELTEEDIEYIKLHSVPLLSIGQLIDFIEWRTKESVLVRNDENKGYFLHVFITKENDSGKFVVYTSYKKYSDNLIEMLWDCACTVALDEKYDKNKG